MANILILGVMAAAFGAAWYSQQRERFLMSWLIANSVMAASLVVFALSPDLPDPIVYIFANGVLLASFGYRWRGIRQFYDRPAPHWLALMPFAAYLVVSAVPMYLEQSAIVYGTVNVLLTAVTFAAIYEILRQPRRSLSQYGLLVAYLILSVSFAVRAGQGIFDAQAITSALPQDAILYAHLIVATIHTSASGAFALSMAFERNAEQLRNAALSDELTGLANRRAFDERLRALIDAAPSGGFAVVLFDIDHFKTVNDRYGHSTGDLALKRCAALCAAHLRAGDTVARIGGEEFAAILPHITPFEAHALAERIRSAVAGTRMSSPLSPFSITISAGIYHSSEGPGDLDSVMRAADSCLYRAKRNGRNRVEPFAGLIAGRSAAAV
ncbi:GGDEF domain-containing protein [Pelagibacterium xiamenense]|uniref:GGDEF domain-containing protein n=1 Tax=Pelagibacterium xiamenense TaxID=2901140 RepID=UPI001E552196|nr:GGDEF domain-containing protein [Pelagibacterium xiamenense]MCD7059630.1 GGDEF domain-containing protein [Pelagibacterium xiamenense]